MKRYSLARGSGGTGLLVDPTPPSSPSGLQTRFEVVGYPCSMSPQVSVRSKRRLYF